MRTKNIILLCLFFFLTLGASHASSERNVTEFVNQDGKVKHVVAKGETLYSIATAYQVKVIDICKLNPGAEKSIREGQILTLPLDVKLEKTLSETENESEPENEMAGATTHEVAKKETLYGVAHKYGLKVGELLDANPGLSIDNFKAGISIRIPERKLASDSIIVVDENIALLPNDTLPKLIDYKVGTLETLYSISRKHNVTIDEVLEVNPDVAKDGLKGGSTIKIPATRIGVKLNDPSTLETTVRIGILLPFLESGLSLEREKIIEYYEGVLIAIKDAKKNGLNAEIYTFDIGSSVDVDRLKDILSTSEMSRLNMVIGGISAEQVKLISSFSKEKNIPYVVPFSAPEKELKDNPMLYQATNSHSNLYAKAIDGFKKLYVFTDYNIIFVEDSSESSNKEEFVKELKNALAKSKVSYLITQLGDDFSSSMAGLLDANKKNVVILNSSSYKSIRSLTSSLDHSSLSRFNINLFGYPEWQVYTTLNQEYYKYNTYLYSMFFADSSHEKVHQFDDDYKLWYGKQMINSYPCYAHLGYDTATYFLTVLKGQKSNLGVKGNSMPIHPLQSAIHFKKISGTGGYINDGLYFVHYNAESQKEKIDLNRKWEGK